MDEGDLTPEIRAIQLPGKVIISATMSFSLSAHFPICPLLCSASSLLPVMCS